jgi:outer membrane lipoprotein SlyB
MPEAQSQAAPGLVRGPGAALATITRDIAGVAKPKPPLDHNQSLTFCLRKARGQNHILAKESLETMVFNVTKTIKSTSSTNMITH